MMFTELDPDTGYITNNMLIPKGRINLSAVQNALTFIFGEEEVIDPITKEITHLQPKTVELFDETTHHVIVPRQFLKEEDMRDLQIPWETVPYVDIPIGFTDSIACRSDLQQAAFDALVESEEGTLNLGCGKGKTVMALKYAAHLNVPTLVVVNTTYLLEQWKKEAKRHLGLTEAQIGVIQGKQLEWDGFPLVIAMVHTLANRRENWPMEMRKRFGLVVFDEAHHMSAPYFVRAADLFYGRRLSLTATASRTDGLEAIYQYHLGRVFYSDLNQPLIPETVFYALNWVVPTEDLTLLRDKQGDTNLARVRTYLGTRQDRNEFILNLLYDDVTAGRQALVLSHSVDHLKELGDLWGTTQTGHSLVIGATDQAHRVQLLEEGNPVFGTFQLAREGLDKPALDTLYVLSPFSNSNDLQQAWGRIQRQYEGKQGPVVRYFEDINITPCSKSANTLRKYLKALGWGHRKVKTIL